MTRLAIFLGILVIVLYRRRGVERPAVYVEDDDGVQPVDPYLDSLTGWTGA